MSRIRLANPELDQNGFYTVPDIGEGFAVLQSIFFHLSTDAGAGTRRMSLIIRNKSGDIVIQFVSQFTQAPLKEVDYSFVRQVDSISDVAVGSASEFVMVPIPLFELQGGDVLELAIDERQTSDQIQDWFLVISDVVN